MKSVGVGVMAATFSGHLEVSASIIWLSLLFGSCGDRRAMVYMEDIAAEIERLLRMIDPWLSVRIGCQIMNLLGNILRPGRCFLAEGLLPLRQLPISRIVLEMQILIESSRNTFEGKENPLS